MKLHKLTTDEAALLCACGLKPTEPGHDRRCPCWLARRQAQWRVCSQRLRQNQRALRSP
jgi:hypothetical protein